MKLGKLIKKILIFFVLFILVITVYSTFIEHNFLVVKHEKLYIPNFSPEHNGLKIAILSDIHYGGQFTGLKKLKKYVDKTNAENPDYIFLLGDLDSREIIKSKTNFDDITDLLKQLHAKYGVISILGNHDFRPSIVKPIIEKAGIPVLENTKIVENINNKPLIIYGLKDLWVFNTIPQNVLDKNDKGNSIIVLSHNPDLFPDMPDFASITLSGHLHGGQVYMPILGGIFTPSIWGQRYNKGYIVENGKNLYVTSGLGGSVPFRFGIIPEIVVLELYSQDSFPDKKIENTKPIKGIHHSLNALGVKIYFKTMDILHRPY